VSHVITGLGVGGAEMMLVKLAGAMDRRRFQSHVISLSSDTALADAITQSGAELDVLNVRPTLTHALPTVARVIRSLTRARPDLVQTWLYHADFIGGLAARRLGVPVIWNVQSSTLDPAGISRRTIRTVKLCAWSSRFLPRVIVSCSHAAVEVHRQIGYQDKFRVIPNGANLDVFRPDAEARHAVRRELGLDDATPLIGMVARFHPQKDHAGFLAAAADLRRSHPQVRFLLCGLGLSGDNDAIMSPIRQLGLEKDVSLLGLRLDLPRIYNALDILTLSSSFGEGFPNVIVEAMATGVPCVVTDVGDSRIIVGETGVTVPRHDPAALARGWRSLLELPADEFADRRAQVRARVAEHFSLAASVAQYERLYDEVAG
jgi:glycosyltransferase involved in cell wall biosynthesis